MEISGNLWKNTLNCEKNFTSLGFSSISKFFVKLGG
jgi:hypothetical protein